MSTPRDSASISNRESGVHASIWGGGASLPEPWLSGRDLPLLSVCLEKEPIFPTRDIG